jgi:serine/threonine-protein kinase RsbW
LSSQCTVPAQAAQLAVLNRFLRDAWTAAGLALCGVASFELALEEIFMNIVMHGNRPGATCSVAVSLSRGADAVTMAVEDDGPPFDPLSLPAPDLTATLEERRVGGLGVHLVREVMDEVSYLRIAERNQLRMSKRLRD